MKAVPSESRWNARSANLSLAGIWLPESNRTLSRYQQVQHMPTTVVQTGYLCEAIIFQLPQVSRHHQADTAQDSGSSLVKAAVYGRVGGRIHTCDECSARADTRASSAAADASSKTKHHAHSRETRHMLPCRVHEVWWSPPGFRRIDPSLVNEAIHTHSRPLPSPKLDLEPRNSRPKLRWFARTWCSYMLLVQIRSAGNSWTQHEAAVCHCVPAYAAVHTKAVHAVTPHIAGTSSMLLNASHRKNTGYNVVKEDPGTIIKHHQLQPRIEEATAVKLHFTRYSGCRSSCTSADACHTGMARYPSNFFNCQQGKRPQPSASTA